ncbi:MAG: NnrS family protein [Betaproteobacteria bacterium]|nr:NnrS family protein [Betaproteobacteria bacterium]
MVIPIARAAAEPTGPRSTWSVWTSAPHRMLFLPGALQLVVTLLLVAWEVGGRSLGYWPTPAWAVPPAWSHAYLMLFGLFPWFVFGFAMTAVPNWINVRLRREAWLACALPMIAGIVLFYSGLLTSRGLVVAGGFLQLAGWIAGAAALARIVFSGSGRDPQANAIVVLLFVGAICAAVFLGAIACEEAGFVAVAGQAGVWLFLLPIFLVVSHRMVPFFSSRVLSGYAMYRPAFSLPFLGAACATHFLLESASLPGWTWVADAPMAAWVGWLAWKWGITQSFRARLLAMLHIALGVLAASLALSAVASLAVLAGHPGLFGRGPLHLLGVGYFAAMTMAMVSRVSLGHSGRALKADRATWYGFLAIIAVGVVRAAADFAPLAGTPRAVLLGLSALAWITIAASWAVRFVPVYLKPRSDGRPG